MDTEEDKQTTNGRLKINVSVALQLLMLIGGLAVAYGAIQSRVATLERRADMEEMARKEDRAMLLDIKDKVTRIDTTQINQRREDRQDRVNRPR